MRRRAGEARVTAAIERWILALERAQQCRTVSASLAQVIEYGCPLHGQAREADGRVVGLVEAERAVASCTQDERRLLTLKYHGGRQVAQERRVNGVLLVYRRAVWPHDSEVADALGLTVATMRRRLRRARAKVADALDG